MNWLLFGLLWGAAFFIKFMAEQPETIGEKAVIGIVYTVGCLIIAAIVPTEHTIMGLAVVSVPLAADGIVKIYRHREIGRIYGTFAE